MSKKIISFLMVIGLLINILALNVGAVSVNSAEVSAMGNTLGNQAGFLLSDGNTSAKVYVDTAKEEMSSGDGHEYCGLEIIANTFAGDVGLVTGKDAEVVTSDGDMSGNVIIAGTIGGNEVIDKLIAAGSIDVTGLYKDGKLKWDCYQMQFVDGSVLASAGYGGVNRALVITGSNKRGAMYGLFNISEHIGVSAWVYMADAVPAKYDSVYLDESLLEFGSDGNNDGMYLAKEPSVKYRGFFINDESPSFTGWAGQAFGGLNENCYEHIFELLIRMKANYMWPAMWGNSFSDEGKAFKLANVVLADAYGVCMGTSHHEACCRAGVEWQRIYRQYGNNNAWDYSVNSDAIYKFWKEGIERNGDYESTITMGMRGEGDSALKGGVQTNIDILKDIITDQNEIISDYIAANPDSKAKDALKIYIPYSENEEYYYGPDDGSIEGLNVWDGMDDVTIMLTDDNYGNVRSLPEESVRNREAGFGLYYHLDGHVGTGAYEWVSSTQLEHIWDQLTMAYDYNVRNIWVVNVGDIKPVEMELNYAMDIAYDMEKWGQENTADTYRKMWLTAQLGGVGNCPSDIAEGIAECVADFLKISTYRKAEYVKSDLYSIDNYNEAQNVLALCEKTINEADDYYAHFRGTEWDDAYYQIVYYQAVGTANVTRMQIYKGLNDYFAARNSSLANVYAGLVNDCVEYDKELTDYYNNKMSNGKWKKMMSSPHVGFVSWDSSGWSYPSPKTVKLGQDAKMLVTLDGSSDIYEKGDAALPLFTNTVKQRYCITLSNGGTDEYSFTIGTLADWIQITDKTGDRIVNGGIVKDAAYVYVSIDWSRVRSDKTGTIVIRSVADGTADDKEAQQEVKITVNTSYTEYKSKGIGTHFESNDVVVIDGCEFINNTPSEDGTIWSRINGYGRYDSAMKMLPTTKSFTKPTGGTYEVKGGNTVRTVTDYEENYDAPYLEYRFYVDEEDDYTFTMYTTTTNNIFKPSGWGYVPVELFYGISVDDGFMQQINSLPDGKYISYAADGDNKWIDGIKNNIHVSTSSEHMTEGLHTVRIYGMHAGLGVERLVISNKDIKQSYLGPEKTFMLDYDIIPEQKTGVHSEAAVSELSYGKPENLSDITDASDTNDPADSYEEETAIPRPYVPDNSGSQNTGNTGSVPGAYNNSTGQSSATGVPTTTATGNTDRSTTGKKVVKGKNYSYKGGIYKVTKATKKGGKVTYMSPVKKNVKKITIPSRIKLGKKTYTVTAISKNAFKKCKNLKSVTVPKKLYKKCKKANKKIRVIKG